MNRRVGILGGGQLAMYLCADARRLGLQTHIIAHQNDAPAAATADAVTYACFDDINALDALVADVDVVTFDVEDIPPAALKYLASRAALADVEVHPEPSVMLLLQDKLLQKQWLLRNGLPTLPFVALDADCDRQARAATVKGIGLPFVQKTRRGGYDGRGVQVIRDAAEVAQLWPAPSMLEPYLADCRELAVLAARSSRGDIECYEPVELTFNKELNVLDAVIAPAPISGRQKALAQAIAKKALERLEAAGLFALELFLTSDGDLVINEISPRVHNSGHHTMESCETSQFEQHLRAICGLPLGATLQIRPTAMRNLLADEPSGTDSSTQTAGAINIGGDTFVHWYGKREASPGRKMGHVTALADSVVAARQRVDSGVQTARRTLERSS